MGTNEAGKGIMCALHEKAIADMMVTLDKILAQTTATNGRLRALERWKLAIVFLLVGIMVGMSNDGAFVHAVVAKLLGCG